MKIPDCPNPTDVFPRRDIIAWWAERNIPDDGSSAEDRNKKLRRERDRLRKQLLRAIPPDDDDDGYELEFGKSTAVFRHPPEKYRNEHTPRLMEIANGVPATIELSANSSAVSVTSDVRAPLLAPLMDYPRDMDDALKQISDLRLQIAALQGENRELRLVKEKYDTLIARLKKSGEDGGRGNEK